jgi:hypothetical protein
MPVALIPQESVLGQLLVSREPLLASNTHLVKHSWCWRYRKYARGDTVQDTLEKAAREEQKACVGRIEFNGAVGS